MIDLSPTNDHQAWHGLIPYDQSLRLQNKVIDQIKGNPLRKSQPQTYVLGFEYNKTLTLGKRLKISELKITSPELFELFQIFETERGGLITLHGRGQLVIYPILNLSMIGAGVRDYLQLLHQVTEDFLKHYGIRATWKNDYPDGLYTQKGKIVFCGVRIKDKVTSHGISINVSNALNEFNSFKPCGHQALQQDRIADHSTETDLSKLFHVWCQIFSEALREEAWF